MWGQQKEKNIKKCNGITQKTLVQDSLLSASKVSWKGFKGLKYFILILFLWILHVRFKSVLTKNEGVLKEWISYI